MKLSSYLVRTLYQDVGVWTEKKKLYLSIKKTSDKNPNDKISLNDILQLLEEEEKILKNRDHLLFHIIATGYEDHRNGDKK